MLDARSSTITCRLLIDLNVSAYVEIVRNKRGPCLRTPFVSEAVEWGVHLRMKRQKSRPSDTAAPLLEVTIAAKEL